MKFIRKDQSVISYQDRLSFVNKEVSPINEIINRKDLSEFYYVDDKTISFKELIQIQVNVIDVGVMIFVFETVSFNKDKFVEDVSKLKEIQITSFYDVLSKIKALYAVSETFNPLFAIYVPNGKYQIYEDCFKTVAGNINMSVKVLITLLLNQITLDYRIKIVTLISEMFQRVKLNLALKK